VSPPELGVTLPQFNDDPARVVDGALRAEALGLDSVWLFDHLWPLTGGKRRPLFESWTTLAYLAEHISAIRIGTLVTRSTLRHPALLAKMAGTVASVAPGRLIVAVGSGDSLSRAENDAFGLPRFSGARRRAQLDSTLRVLIHSARAEALSQHDDFVRLDSFPLSPRPPSRPSFWAGGRAPKMLEVAGRLADGWNGWGLGPADIARSAAAVRSAAGGRAVKITWAGLALLAEDDASAHAKLGPRDPSAYLVGGPERVATELRARAEAGATHLILTFPDAADPHTYELLAKQVRPRLG
jgi:alkanesulfonate monooxygenase SsuD/methylene tetrahydromethanopterin reductase-like flavin-dependent oxidoreductase (luciferase family)